MAPLKSLKEYYAEQRAFRDRLFAERAEERRTANIAAETDARRQASDRPVGIACPKCGAELGEAPLIRHVNTASDDLDNMISVSSQRVLCPSCGLKKVIIVVKDLKEGR